MNIIESYRNNIKTISSEIEELKAKLDNNIKLYMETNEFKQDVLKAGRKDPVRFFITVFAKKKDSDIIFSESEHDYDYQVDEDELKKITKEYSDVLSFLLNEKMHIYVDSLCMCNSDIFLDYIKIIDDYNLQITILDELYEDWELYTEMVHTKHGKKFVEISKQLIEEFGVETFIQNEDFNNFIFDSTYGTEIFEVIGDDDIEKEHMHLLRHNYLLNKLKDFLNGEKQ